MLFSDWRLQGGCEYAWLTLDAPTAVDLANAGAAWLNEDEWEYAKSALQRSLDLEEQAYPLYLQALAIKGDRHYYSLHGEERISIINLLQKAQTLDDCPADALLLLDDLLHHDDSSDRSALLKEAIQLYPEHTELCLRYARHLAYETNDYIEALIVAEPLLLQAPPSQRALDCAVWSAYKLEFFEDALAYANQLRPSSFWSHGPTVEQVKGDIYLAWGKTDEALACYKLETQRDDFEAAFLGFFRIANVWLVLNEHEKALAAALEGAALWLDYPNKVGCSRALSFSSVSVGEPGDHADAALHFSGGMVQDVCKSLLYADQETDREKKGVLAYLLYKVYQEIEHSDDESETMLKRDNLLLTVAQGSHHPHIGEDIASYYAEKKDIARAIETHIEYCLWKLSALREHPLKPKSDEEDERLLVVEWRFSEYDAELSCDQELLESLSGAEQEHCHTIAWKALQIHITQTDVVTSIFVPFFNSFWSDLLIAGNMHHAVVKTARLLIQAAADDETLWWLLAYHSRKLEHLDEAERAYRRYIELVPDSDNALHNLSLILEKKGTLQEALALSQKAAALSPDDEIIVKNARRLTGIDTEQQQAQQKQEGAILLARLTDSQRWLLCLAKLYPSSHWSALLPPN